MPLHLSFLLFAASLAAYGGERTVGQNDYSSSSLCQQSLVCGNNVDVRYPFFLADANGTAAFDGNTNTSSSNCGYPGMMIACEAGRATLKLMGDNYTVLDINYDNHTVTVADADALSGGDCPRVTHNVSIPMEIWLNLSTTANGNLVFFFGCVFTAATPPPAVSPINCSSFRNLDGESYVETEPDVTPPEQWPRACKESVVVPVLKDALLGSSSGGGNLSRLNSDGYSKVLKQGFQLTWDDPTAGPCRACEQSGGWCGHNQTGEFFECLCSDGRCGPPSSSKKKITAYIVSAVSGAILLSLLFVMCVFVSP